MKYLFILILAAGCAKTADSVAPAAMPLNSVSCSQITELRQRVGILSAKQNTAAGNDVVGVIFIGLPIGSMSGGDVETELAIAKGQLLVAEAKC